MSAKPQRIRDPLHNLIEFGTSQFEQTLWKVIQTENFQRLRRIKQLGFSELVYPGATHTRFAHSLGVYHVATKLLDVVKNASKGDFNDIRGKHVLAAALLHDIGHGPFSHAFEQVGERLCLKMVNHESVSQDIIRGDTITGILNTEYGKEFATNVADILDPHNSEKHFYSAIVSSQFDADRLDYMQRDRLMTGTRLGGVDFEWLISNLKIGEMPYYSDDSNVQLGSPKPFML